MLLFSLECLFTAAYEGFFPLFSETNFSVLFVWSFFLSGNLFIFSVFATLKTDFVSV